MKISSEHRSAHALRMRDYGGMARIDLLDEDGRIFASCEIDRPHAPSFVTAVCRFAGVTAEDFAEILHEVGHAA